MANAYERKIPMLDCGHDYIRQVLHGRWKIALLLRIRKGIVRPGELARSIPQATRRVLDAQLAELIRHGLISKLVYDEHVPRVEYHLTDLGMSLMTVVDVMGKWGTENLNELRKLVNS
ncbi:helix-turn-helix transcriptional regulator [Mucilaginibacter robiniae]|uniref:Helix-turn-helix transcriptional regulator n=1 Tax=Mucilaginibacter robiniae TaxID=2728022 RepID=A0A7L5E731_9SPHI|nr:winged helix-turn-helix transcriptional regulator [Mucilaginibacter robiniae]QJD96653.1 helix-turn-helix transcriptional regulator [Mucilaginibacter robiniae]